MFKGNRSFEFAFALLIFILGGIFTYLATSPFEAKRNEATYHGYATSKAHANADKIYRNQCRKLKSVDHVIECIDEYVKTQGDTQRAQENLYAQKQMAQTAWWMLLTAGFVGVLTILAIIMGVYWVKKTL